MITELSAEAVSFGDTARRALEAGGVAALDGLGAWDLDPLGSEAEREAAAALCRAAGWCAVTDPVASRLAPPPGPDLGGDDGGVALGLVLPCWTLLGMLDRAIDLTVAYVQDRRQFGETLASFQGVQFQLTEAEVERVGLEELAKYALWSMDVDDALALRLAALEAAEVVFRVSHQLHGAIGFCDETALSWLSRASQPLRRRPLGLSATRAALVGRLGRRGLSGLFG